MLAAAHRFLLAYALLAARAIAGGWWDGALLLGAALLLGQPALRLFLLAEHSECDTGPDMLRNSRTTRSNPFVGWLAWNRPYHFEHHAYPWVPYHALPAAHQAIAGHGQVTARGYLRVHREMLRGFRPG